MNSDNRRRGGPQYGSGLPSNNAWSRRPRKENIRFGVNDKRTRKSGGLVIDEHIQEATPEHLRIEIDKIITEFLADPDKKEYIFPSDLNNLQRKYIHYKAQIMNIVSKSHGKEPNRQLHLKKKPRQVASQTFHIYPCEEIRKSLEEFDEKFGEVQAQPQNYRAVKRYEKVYGRLQDIDPIIPQTTRGDQEVQFARRKLPIFEKKNVIMEAIDENQVIIISSETGSGKTTQIPQYLMEDASQNKTPCKIICTQPRRISTVAAAERVAYERGESLGGSVGYHIRLESKCSNNTNLVYCTVGVFLRNLMCGNKCLSKITHVIVDEIHERDKLSDFMLICLKQNLPVFKHLKVILMSATVDTTKFQEYFQASTVLTIPGRVYPIHTYFLENILDMTKFFTPQMRLAMNKLQQQQAVKAENKAVANVELSEQDQENLDFALEAYMNFSEDYDYTIHYEEATADLLQMFISEDVPVDQQHSDRGWTALMLACHLGDVEFISKLCTMGATMAIYDKFGKTAYDYAKVSNKNGTVQLLDYINSQKTDEKTPNANDIQYLRQLYDMTTPDDFIDYDLVIAIIKYIEANSDEGAILIFLPGYDDIMSCNDHIVDSDLDMNYYRIFFLHSSMNMKEQRDVFKTLPDQRKIILSTNIAETSITVQDVVFVIDAGKAKEKVYDSYNKLSALQTQWISRACAEQRKGRAGRVQTGVCFRLYSNQRFIHMAEERVPEILRVSLEELCLNAKIIAPTSMNIYNFLSLAPDPPTANSVAAAIENLQSLGALDKEEDLTRMGEYLAQLTLEPRLGKMLIYGCIFKCLEPILTLCAGMAHKDPFQLPPQANLRTAAAAKRRELIDNVPSDHVVYLRVFQRWQEESARGRSKQFCHDYFISESTMHSVLETRRQLLGQLRAVGFVNNTHNIDEFNINSDSWGLVKAIMSAAFFPNIAHPIQRGLSLSTRNEKKVSIHNLSVCNAKVYNYWCFFDEMVKNRIGFMVRGVTLFTPLTVAIMCGIDCVYPSSHSMNVDDWLEFYFGDTLVIKFRSAVQTLVEKSMLNPWHSFHESNQIVSETLRKVMDMEEDQAQLAQPKAVGARPKFLYKIINDSKSTKSNPITRNGMRQKPPAANSYKENSASGMRQYSAAGSYNKHNYTTDSQEIEEHKKGLTPKRYIPPNKRNIYPSNSGTSKALNFDNIGASTSAASVSGVSHKMQDMTLSTGSGNLNPAAALMKGLGVDPEANTSHNIYSKNSTSDYDTNVNSYPNYGTDRSNSYNNYGINRGYGPERGYSYGRGSDNGFVNNYGLQRNGIYDYTGYNYNSGYGNSPGNNGVLVNISNNKAGYSAISSNENMARKIVKKQDLTDFQYNDVYSMPAFLPKGQCPSFFDFGLDSIDFFKSPPFSEAQSHSPGMLKMYKNQENSTAASSTASDKDCDYPDNPIYVLIRASEKKNTDIAQSCNKWVFSPQTERKIVVLSSQEKVVYLVFYVKVLQMFMGIAEYKHLNLGKNFTKPTATIIWKYTAPLHRNKTKHLLNPYNDGKSIFDAQDGTVIRQDVGEELMRIYSEAEGVKMGDRYDK